MGMYEYFESNAYEPISTTSTSTGESEKIENMGADLLNVVAKNLTYGEIQKLENNIGVDVMNIDHVEKLVDAIAMFQNPQYFSANSYGDSQRKLIATERRFMSSIPQAERTRNNVVEMIRDYGNSGRINALSAMKLARGITLY